MNLALIQHSFKGNKKATIDFTLAKIAEAAQNGANLIALQELHTSEYFCQKESVEFFKYGESFEDEKAIFARAAKENGVVIVASLFEKRARGLYHNTACVFERDGNLAGIYRKSHIPDDPNFYEKFYFTPSECGFQPIETSLGKIGMLICWDQWFPEAARIMALKGAEILIYPTAIGWDLRDSDEEKKRQLEAWINIQRGHAIANGVFVCAINRCGFEAESGDSIRDSRDSSDSRADSSESSNLKSSNLESKITQNRGIHFWGNSFIFGPQGEEIARASENCDEILRAEINLARIDEVRNIWPFLRDRRIECYGDILKRFVD